MGPERLGRRAVGRWLSALVLVAGACSGTASPQGEASPEPASSSVSPAAADPGCADLQADALVQRVVDTSLVEGRATYCVPGTTNGQGYVAIGRHDDFGYPGPVYEIWRVKPRSGGASLGSFVIDSPLGGRGEGLLPQGDGWLSAEPFPESDVMYFRSWPSTGSPDNTPLHGTQAFRGNVAPDFTSGALLVYPDPEDFSFILKAQRFDALAMPRSAAAGVAGGARGFVAAGVDAFRDSLVLFDGASVGLPQGHVAGRWLDPCGAALTDVFDTGLTYAASGVLAPLYDGSLVLQLGGQWVARFPHLSTAPAAPAPAWLAERPNTRLVWIRHGKGYALVPNPGEDLAQCHQQILLYSKKGNACGVATFVVDDLPCTTRGITVGPDGTVVLLSPRQGPCEDDRCFYRGCTYFWWPEVLGFRGSARASERPPKGTHPLHCGPAGSR